MLPVGSLLGNHRAVVHHRKRNDERVGGASPASLPDHVRVQAQYAPHRLLDLLIERAEQVSLCVRPLLSVVVASREFALNLIDRPNLTGTDHILDPCPQTAKHRWPEEVSPTVQDGARIEGIEHSGQTTLRSSADSANLKIWLTLASR